jgi:hypothetical protein
MKLRIALIVIAAVALVMSARTFAQDLTDSQILDDLRRQLSEVQDAEAGVKMRLQELDFELKPENIERHFNGYGSTRPEELRELRRKQLQTEKDRLLGQQSELATRRASLDSAITLEQSRAYQRLAQGAMAPQPGGNWFTHLFTFTKILVTASVFLVVLGGLALRVFIRQRHNI